MVSLTSNLVLNFLLGTYKYLHLLKPSQVDRAIMFLFILMISGCSDRKIYKSSENPEWHVIDLKSFQISIPREYRFEPHKGIDSFVGVITNGDVVIRFDYGCYSSRGLMDKVDVVDKFQKRLDIRNLFEVHDLLDPTEVPEKNEVLLQLMDQQVFDSISIVGCATEWNLKTNLMEAIEFCQYVEFDGKSYLIPYVFEEFVLENESTYNYERDTLNGIHRKIYFDRFESDTMKIGLYLSDRTNFNESINSYCETIGMFAEDLSVKELSVLKQVFRSVRLE